MKHSAITQLESGHVRAGTYDFTSKCIFASEHTSDATDAYGEVADPQNEYGDMATAHFEVDQVDAWSADPDVEAHANTYHLIGVEVESNDSTSYRCRQWCLDVLGFDAVRRLEEVEEV